MLELEADVGRSNAPVLHRVLQQGGRCHFYGTQDPGCRIQMGLDQRRTSNIERPTSNEKTEDKMTNDQKGYRIQDARSKMMAGVKMNPEVT
ncbi:MAG: hypothetical protein CVU57_19320 [Deltaproteobacteria bacterium HGW-Deltaproteobacteria-15]|nr:MAG: hypothetical protein CVU57_19320 [Deltaproteobacteria bacterium HGW-Deltaproteobacteria-15]